MNVKKTLREKDVRKTFRNAKNLKIPANSGRVAQIKPIKDKEKVKEDEANSRVYDYDEKKLETNPEDIKEEIEENS